MSRLYQTAKGKMIDIDKVKLANETAIAVGNMKVNARGDKIGPGGTVVAGRNQVMDNMYAVPSAPQAGGYSPNDPTVFAEQQTQIQASTPQELNDLVNNLTTPPAKTNTGDIANNSGKPAEVKQEPIPDPRQPKGPARI